MRRYFDLGRCWIEMLVWGWWVGVTGDVCCSREEVGGCLEGAA